jgi:hypothetical protein
VRACSLLSTPVGQQQHSRSSKYGQGPGNAAASTAMQQAAASSCSNCVYEVLTAPGDVQGNLLSTGGHANTWLYAPVAPWLVPCWEGMGQGPKER